MDKNRVTGKLDQGVGKAKEKVGEAVGNQRLANQGVADQVKGAAKETWGNAKDAARTAHDRHAAEAEDSANTHREHVTDKVAEMKKKANAKIDNFKDRERAKHGTHS
ncbi:MAG: CsbD family protein [Acidobacteriaceae bacterium]